MSDELSTPADDNPWLSRPWPITSAWWRHLLKTRSRDYHSEPEVERRGPYPVQAIGMLGNRRKGECSADKVPLLQSKKKYIRKKLKDEKKSQEKQNQIRIKGLNVAQMSIMAARKALSASRPCPQNPQLFFSSTLIGRYSTPLDLTAHASLSKQSPPCLEVME